MTVLLWDTFNHKGTIHPRIPYIVRENNINYIPEYIMPDDEREDSNSYDSGIRVTYSYYSIQFIICVWGVAEQVQSVQQKMCTVYN